MDEDIQEENPSLLEDPEWELENLQEFDNKKQLDLLIQEANHIMIHGLEPPIDWYNKRFPHIMTYSHLNWIEIAQQFHNKDKYVHDKARWIMRALDELIEEREVKPTFHLPTYYRVLHEIKNIWAYYQKEYVCDEDDDMLDLIIDMKFM